MNTTRLSFISALVLGALAPQLGGCDAPDTAIDGDPEIATHKDAFVLGASVVSAPPSVAIDGSPVTGGPDTSTVTLFSEAALGGDALTQSVVVSSANESVGLVTFDQIEAAKLVSRISSVRLVCGTRPSQVMLFDFPNTGPLMNWWNSGPVFVLECKPHEIVTANLHTAAPLLADRVGSAHLLAHARAATTLGFSSFIASKWNGHPLPDGASAPEGVELQMIGSTGFELRQNLVLDAWACGAHDAFLVLRAMLNADRTFTVSVKQTYVDEGTGDTWGCRDGMLDRLKSGALDSAHELKSGIDDFMRLAGNHPRFYLVPLEGLRVFGLAGGGDLVVPGRDLTVTATLAISK